ALKAYKEIEGSEASQEEFQQLLEEGEKMASVGPEKKRDPSPSVLEESTEVATGQQEKATDTSQ
ncbi:hypothetical protein IWQ62_006946, partial [Dispira parvispora]